MTERKKFRKLSKSVVPTHYDISLEPDLENFTFTGKETVDINIVKETYKIVLNCLDVNVVSVTYTPNEGEPIQPNEIKYSEDEEIIKFKFDGDLPLGTGKLYIEFTGVLNDQLKGFYRSAQGTGENKQYAAVTHFEPTDARRAFPCWDEPAIKCTFDITLVVPKDKVALSNMNVIETSQSSKCDHLKIVKFATTPKMSTYIIAFIVGDFDFVEDKTESGVVVRVYTSCGKSEEGKFALDVAKRTLTFYEDYFSIPYGLPKIDLIGVADFGIGAMENWGLVTYRERYLLFDEKETSIFIMQRVAEIIGHELAHNWFGNLVTMEWWTHLWLKEGFANFMEHLCVDHLFPEFDIWCQFLLSQNIMAQKIDVLKNSHPIEVPVGHPSEVSEIFDRISYSKGASVIRMLHQYVGKQEFKTGVHNYLKKHQHGNTVTEDLWDSLQLASKKPVSDVMSTWTKQMGFPLVSVKKETISDNKVVLKLTQTKFVMGYEGGKGYHWLIPINISTSRHPDEVSVQILMSDQEMLIYLDNLNENDWIKVNPGQTDYYRTQYSENMLEVLKPAIESKALSNKDRVGIQNDMFAMAMAGYVDFTEYIQLLDAYTDETDYTVWSDIVTNIYKLKTLFDSTDSCKEFQSFVMTLLTLVAGKIGYEKKEGESKLESMLRSCIYTLLGTFGHEYTVVRFTSLFHNHVNKTELIDTDLRSAVYATVATHGDATVLEQLKELYFESNIVDEKSRILSHLGRFQDDSLKDEVLNFSISDDVRNQDTLLALSGCLNSHEGRVKTWNFIKSHWDVFQERCAGGHARANLIKSAIENFSTEEEFKDAQDFLETHAVAVAARTIKQSMESIRTNINALARVSVVF